MVFPILRVQSMCIDKSINSNSFCLSPLTTGHALFFQPQVFVKCLVAGLSAEKFYQCLHLILAATLFKDHVSVSSSFFLIHRVLLEDGVVHVGAVHLRREVTVISSLRGKVSKIEPVLTSAVTYLVAAH